MPWFFCSSGSSANTRGNAGPQRQEPQPKRLAQRCVSGIDDPKDDSRGEKNWIDNPYFKSGSFKFDIEASELDKVRALARPSTR